MAVVSSISRVRTSEPFELQVARGQISYHKTIFKFGYNSAVGDTKETIWEQGGLYAYPPSASVMTVSSSDANDTSAGTGARTVEIFGLDADYNEINEIVTLNGQTAVNTTKSYLRINRGLVRSAGSGGANAGIIYAGTGTVTSGVPANIYLTINGDGDNQTLMALWTVPANYTAFLTKMSLSTGTSTNTQAVLNSSLVARPYGEVFQIKERFTLTDGAHEQFYTFPLRFTEKTDLEMRGFSSSNSVDFNVSASMEFVYIKNDSLV
tara:strand:+ start:287 stop:1081 length:795 start_codon:yes stop_codon:yes gene_type:complete